MPTRHLLRPSSLILHFALSVLLLCPAFVRADGYAGSYPYRVVATIGMVGDVVREIAGDRANVTTLLGPGVDPHTYSPSRNDVVALTGADVIFYNGLLLEGRMTDLFVRLARQRPIYPVTELLDEEYLLEHEDYPGQADPHVWMDVKGWMAAADRIVEALSEFDPAGADVYTGNGAVYREKLRALDEYARRAFATIPEDRRVMVTAHDAFRYLGRAYGIEVHGIQGLSTDSEAGLADINRLVSMLVERRIPAVFVETSVADKNVRALIEGARSRGHAVRIGGELFSDAMGSAGKYEGTYIGMIDHNVTTIVRALGGEAPSRGYQGKLSAEVP